jgi:hypothetical protein
MDFVNNSGVQDNEMHFTPTDIKNEFYKSNNAVDTSFIKQVLKKEFKLLPGKNARYFQFNNLHREQRVGMFYTLPLSFFGSRVEKPENDQNFDIPPPEF